MRSVRRLFILSVLTTGAVAACSSETTDQFAPLALSLSLSPTVDTIFVADLIVDADATSLTLTAQSLGHPVHTPSGVEWSSADTSVAVVTSGGAVHAVGIGETTISARVNSSRATATIVVAYRARTLSISPTSLVGLAGDTVQVTASAVDVKGVLVPNTRYVFTSSDPSIATVTATGARTARVLFVNAGLARVNVSAAGQTASATGTIQPRDFLSVPAVGAPAGSTVVSTGADATCGILPFGRAYCFGRGSLLGVSKDTSCANDLGPAEACSRVPVRVAGQLNFVTVSVGDSVACGITADARAYCWGSQKYGQVGNGVTSNTNSVTPSPVVTGDARTPISLMRVSAGGTHVCGIALSGFAYCWGHDDVLQLGNGDSESNDSNLAIAVGSSAVWTSISTGLNHACTLNALGLAFCWGDNSSGQLGAGIDDLAKDRPVAVSGATTFSSISAGSYHTCGVTTAGVAVCWGDNSRGQLGVPVDETDASNVPVVVATGLRFRSISAGRSSTCGIATTGVVYCWGDNSFWQLGSSTIALSDSPLAIGGGRTDFTSVTVGLRNVCASSPSGLYCWGSSVLGALGSNVQGPRQATPTKVVVP